MIYVRPIEFRIKKTFPDVIDNYRADESKVDGGAGGPNNIIFKRPHRVIFFFTYLADQRNKYLFFNLSHSS